MNWYQWQCTDLQCGNGSWWANKPKIKIQLTVEVGDDWHKQQKSVNIDGLAQIDENILGLLSKVEAITAENEYERTQQNAFQHTSERILLNMTVLNILMICGMSVQAVLQTVHLKGYFRTRKLI